jgi:hypothetical protein
MQTSLAQYKIAGYPPDVLINVPSGYAGFSSSTRRLN